MSPWHCARKDRGWITYCGLDLQARVSPSRRREFRYHADRDTFLQEDGRKCATCAAAARREKEAADRAENEKSLSALRTFRHALARAGF